VGLQVRQEQVELQEPRVLQVLDLIG
jgi:hypothetical protein